MKKLFMLFITLLLFIGCAENPVEPTSPVVPIMRAHIFEIDFKHSLGAVYIDFTIINSGGIYINYWEAHIKVITEEGYTKIGQTHGLNLAVGEKSQERFYICVDNKYNVIGVETVKIICQ